VDQSRVWIPSPGPAAALQGRMSAHHGRLATIPLLVATLAFHGCSDERSGASSQNDAASPADARDPTLDANYADTGVTGPTTRDGSTTAPDGAAPEGPGDSGADDNRDASSPSISDANAGGLADAGLSLDAAPLPSPLGELPSEICTSPVALVTIARAAVSETSNCFQ
jgi:hypothetical protein